MLVWFTVVNDIDAILLIASLDSNSNSTSVGRMEEGGVEVECVGRGMWGPGGGGLQL